MTRPRYRLGLKDRQAIWGYVFLAPALVLLAVTVVYPMLRALIFSLYQWPLGDVPKTFVGLDNYLRLILDDEVFHASVANTAYFTVVSVLPTLALAFVAAVMLNESRLLGRSIFRTIYFIPVVTSLVAVAYVWRALLEPTFGLVNAALGWIGITGPGWLVDPAWAMNGIVTMSIWRDLGFYIVIFLAGLQTIPRDIKDASAVDGATGWQGLWRITVPLMNASIVLVAVIGVIAGLQLFTQVQVMSATMNGSAGGPLNSTISVVLFIVRRAFGSLEMGYPSAAAILLLMVILLVTLVQLRFLQRRFDY